VARPLGPGFPKAVTLIKKKIIHSCLEDWVQEPGTRNGTEEQTCLTLDKTAVYSPSPKIIVIISSLLSKVLLFYNILNN
jgi:hypothetical protein